MGQLVMSKIFHHDYLMHPPINILIDFNEFIQKDETLQDINLKGLLQNITPIAPIIKIFQYYHQVQGSNTSKTFNINHYQLTLILTFCLITLKFKDKHLNIW
jgi:hypothetical protein